MDNNVNIILKLILNYEDKRINKIGTNKLIDNFNLNGNIPTMLDNILTEKIRRELKIVQEAILILNEYRKIGFNNFDDRLLFDIQKFKEGNKDGK